jgi:hypothetical protein
MQGIKCGMEVGLASPNSKKMVAMGTVQRTDSKAKGSDGYPLADYVEVLISVVSNQMTMLPRARGKILKLGNATARCIAWPQENVWSLHMVYLISSCSCNSSLLCSKQLADHETQCPWSFTKCD